MQELTQPNTPSLLGIVWRRALLLAIVVGSLAYMLSMQAFDQDQNYHNLADKRAFFGVPNFLDVMSTSLSCSSDWPE